MKKEEFRMKKLTESRLKRIRFSSFFILHPAF
jgi:hypothetical protein